MYSGSVDLVRTGAGRVCPGNVNWYIISGWCLTKMNNTRRLRHSIDTGLT